MKEFIMNYWSSILVVLIFVATLIYFAVKGKKDIVYKMLYALVTEAEKIYGSGTGSLKFAYVLEKIYSYMPAILKVFITYNKLEKMIEDALKKAKDIWAKEAGIETYLKACETSIDNIK